MPYNTYADLSQALQDYMEDDDTEFVGSIDDVINVGENRVVKDLDLAIFRVDDSVTLTLSTVEVTKPTPAAGAQYLAAKAAWITGGALTAPVFLEHRGDQYVNFYNAGAVDGVPKYFADDSDTIFSVAPPPDDAYTLNVRYLSIPARLVDTTNETNWLTDNVPELLFRACLAESEAFLKGDERIALWKQEYGELLMATRRDSYPQQNNQYEKLGAVPVPQANRSAG